MRQRISAKSLRLSCLSHLFFFSKIIENRRSFKKLLIHWIIQFDIFLFIKLCSSLTCDTWLYVFATFTFMIVIILSLSCLHIACISFVSIFSVVSISLSRLALICNFDWLIDSFIRRCDIEYVGPMRIYLLVFTYRKTLQRKKTHIFCLLSTAFRDSLQILSTSIRCRSLSAVRWYLDMFFYWSLIEWKCLWTTVNWINILNFIIHFVNFFSSAVVLIRFR